MSSSIPYEIRFAPVTGTGRHGLIVANSEGQFARKPLLLDASPEYLNDNLVVAAGVIWAADIVDEFRFDGQLSEDVVRSWQKEADISVISTGRSPHAPEIARPTRLSVGLLSGISESTPARDETRLGLVPSERFYGSLTGVKERIVGANAWMFEGEEQGLALVAAGVLYADELLAGELLIETTMSPATVHFINKVMSPLGIHVGQGKL